MNWFNLADLSCSETLYDSASLRRFVGADPGREPVSDALLNFHKRLHDNKPGEALFAQVNAVLQSKGFNLETSVGQVEVCDFLGAWQGVTPQNGHFTPKSYNAAMCRKNRAILPVASSPDR